MQDFLNGEGRLYKESYEFQVLENPATPLAQNINHNISNMIEDVKRQRLDIIKLNNELKNSRSVFDRRSVEEARTRQEAANLLKQLRREKEQLQQEARGLREIAEVAERKLGDRDAQLAELRARNAELSRALAERQREADEQRFTSSKLQRQLDELQNETRASFRQREDLGAMEARANKYFEKSKEEGLKVVRLQKELTAAQESYNLLLDENQKAGAKLKNYLELNAELRRENNLAKTEPASRANVDELRADLRVFAAAYEGLDAIMQDIQADDDADDFDEEGEDAYEDEEDA